MAKKTVNPVMEEIRIRIRKEADMDRWNQIQEEVGISNKSEVGRFMIRKYPLGNKSESNHQELLIFLIKIFMDSGIEIDFPDHLEQQLMEIVQKEL
jgi:hypothetical protein